MIRVLPRELVDFIAAGEFIDSPIAVVRELVENALDAGATRLGIRVWGDEWRLEVLDNGQGMTAKELERCALPHTTSKIQQFSDLCNVTTLGFRGEALHSLAQVSRLAIASRGQQSLDSGWYAHYDAQGNVISSQATAIATGTRVEVRDLFAQFPQRRQALTNAQATFKAIQQYLQRLALCHPSVTWQLWQGDRLRWWVSPAANAQGILAQCLKTVHFRDLTTVEDTLELPEQEDNPDLSARLSVTLATPDRCHRPRPDWIVLAINGRPVHCPELEHTLLSSFYRTLPRHRYPICIAHFHLPPGWIDWNRHPAKTAVYLQFLPHWQAQLQAVIQQGLALTPSQTAIAPTSRVNQLLKSAEPTGVYQLAAPGTSLTDAVMDHLPSLKAIAQVNQTYIIVEHPHGLWLVEQHVAHERILFETLQQQWQCVPLAQPLLLDRLSTEQAEQLQKLGLEIDPFGEDLWAVRSVPQLAADRPDLADLLRELSQLDTLSASQAAIACRSAVKNGTALDFPAIQTLIEQWQRCQHPQTCPHGRPIYLALEESSLARFFRRNWLVGK